MALRQEDRYKKIADRLISKYPIALGYIELDKVLFLAENEKAPKRYADCRNIGWPNNFLTDMEYMIIFYENNMTAMNDAQINLLVMHELMHIGENGKLRKHDVEDFYEIVAIHGPGWATDTNIIDVLDDDATRPTATPNTMDDENEEPEV